MKHVRADKGAVRGNRRAKVVAYDARDGVVAKCEDKRHDVSDEVQHAEGRRVRCGPSCCAAVATLVGSDDVVAT